MQTALITNAASYADSAGRGHLLLIIILVLAGLIIGFLLLAAIGVGVTKGLGALYKVAFPGSLGFLWIVAIIATAAIAFVLRLAGFGSWRQYWP